MDVVVCDDDPGVRRVVSEIATSLGFTVLAETEVADEAVEIADQLESGVLVLDLSLPYGNGLDALRSLRERGSPCRVVVFSAYAFDPRRLTDAGADAVVDKLRFDELEEVLIRLGQVDRRRAPHARRLPAPAALASPSGLEPGDRFEEALDEVRADDVVVVFELDAYDELTEVWGELGTTDIVLDLANHIRRACRAEDRLTGAGDRQLEVVLFGSIPGGALALFERVRFSWEAAGTAVRDAAGDRPTFSCAYAVVAPGELGREALARSTTALDRGQRSGTGRVWPS